MKYLYVKIGKIKKSNIDMSSFPSFPNSMTIGEMRKKWGDDACIIKTAQVCYKVDQTTFDYFKNINRFKI